MCVGTDGGAILTTLAIYDSFKPLLIRKDCFSVGRSWDKQLIAIFLRKLVMSGKPNRKYNQ